jgi:hypothetical protein
MIRISAGLASITLLALFAAHGLGLVPDREAAILDGRKALCEAVAFQGSLAVRHGDLGALKDSLHRLVRRNPASSPRASGPPTTACSSRPGTTSFTGAAGSAGRPRPPTSASP